MAAGRWGRSSRANSRSAATTSSSSVAARACRSGARSRGRYTDSNLREMLASRVDSTRVVGEAIARAAGPPRAWLQMSTATIYAHRYDAANGESTGIIGGTEPDMPA